MKRYTKEEKIAFYKAKIASLEYKITLTSRVETLESQVATLYELLLGKKKTETKEK